MNKLRIDKYKAVIFDLFHTLSSLAHIKSPGEDTSSILKIDRKTWSDALFNKSDERLRGIITDPFEIIKSVALQINPDTPPELIKKAALTRMKRFEYSLVNIPLNTIKTIIGLKERGLKIGLVSNADKIERQGWEKAGISKYFDEAVFSCDAGYVKPEKEIYYKCINALNLTPGECLFVGDGSCNELEGAKNIGMDTVFTYEFLKDLWPEKIEERKKIADFSIENINQLLNQGIVS